jgi:anhydro-N-acetylmuramic acid kinase
MKPKSNALTVAGIMSGTSADGIDVALMRIGGAGEHPKLTLLAHQAFPFPASLRKAILAAMNAQSTSTAELARLNWRLGLAYAEAVKATLARQAVTAPAIKLDLIGCHGQTIYHQPNPRSYAGSRFACTWQLGEAAILAGELQVPVVSNFRPADMVAGGQGAPLVPLLDFVLFRHATRGRILQNIGGIANLTAIPPASSPGQSFAPSQCFAFDTGPGNMVIDQLMLALYRKPMDASGAIAATGQVLEPVLKQALRHPFFRKHPPRTAGREEFGREYATEFLALCRQVPSRKEDWIATATALTAASISQAYGQFVSEKMGSAPVDYVVSGGGARNLTLMQHLATHLKPHRCQLTTTDSFGLPSEAKEAAAFALLAWQTWHRRPGNLPSATGATRPAILGQVTYV